MSLKNIYARVAPVYFEKLSALAETRNQSISELIRGIVCSFLEAVEADEVIFDDTEFHHQAQQFIDDAYVQAIKTYRVHESESTEDEFEEFIDW